MKEFALQFLKINAAFGVYGSMSLSVGGVLGAACLLLGMEHFELWVLCGILIPIGPIYLYFSSERSMRYVLTYLKEWRDAKIITSSEYSEMRTKVLLWYRDRRFAVDVSVEGPISVEKLVKEGEPES